MHIHRTAAVGAALLTAAVTVAGCSTTTPDPGPQSQASASAETTPAESTAATSTPAQADAPAGVSGPACAGYAQAVPIGPGSIGGMAADPVAVAVSNSPLLTTLSGALSGKLNSEVDLADTLNKGEFTVFAPTDDAFGKVDPATIEKLKADAALLKAVLTYHVVPGPADPATVVGEHKSLQGGPLTVTGSGEDLKVNGATVVCGGIKTANATLYLIDTVLMPPPPPAPAPATTSGESTAPTTTPTP